MGWTMVGKKSSEMPHYSQKSHALFLGFYVPLDLDIKIRHKIQIDGIDFGITA